jgi:transposase-like protein
MLVIIGADEYGNKDVLGIMDGFHENADSWGDLLLGLKKQGLTIAPDLACGDGAMDFFGPHCGTSIRRRKSNVAEFTRWPTSPARCPSQCMKRPRQGCQDIWMAATKKEANAAFNLFVETYGVKYDRAVKKLTKDRYVLLTFYDFPAEHWKHIRTANPIESVFATVRNRTRKTKGCLSRKTALSMMVFKLMMSAKKR